MLQHRGRDRCHGQIPIFIRPYHAKEEDKALIKQRDEKMILSGYVKGRIFTLFQPGKC